MFSKLSIKTKLIFLFSFVILLMIAIVFVSIIAIKSIDDLDTELYTHNTLPLTYLNEATREFQRTRVYLYKAAVSTDREEVKEFHDMINKSNSIIREKLEQFENTMQSDEIKKVYAITLKDIDSYAGYQNEIFKLLNESLVQQALELLNKNAALANAVDEDITNLSSIKAKHAKQKSEGNTSSANKATFIASFLTIIALIISFIFAFYIIKSINNSTKKIIELSQLLACGDLTIKFDTSKNDEMGKISSAFSKAVEYMRNIVKIASSHSNNIASNADDLKKTTKELEVVIASNAENITEISHNIDNITRSFRDVVEDSQGVETQVLNGQGEVNCVFEQMGRIEDTNKVINTEMGELNKHINNIYTINDVLKELASETKRLALNASIEAARAGGEIGRAFMEIANGIKELSDESFKSSKEINEIVKMIKEKAANVNNAVVVGNSEIVSGSESVANLRNVFSNIKASINSLVEQAQGVTASAQEINSSTEMIATSSEEQAASTSTIASSVKQLADMAVELKGAIIELKV